MEASALFHTAPGQVAWRPVDLPGLGSEQVLVEAEYSAISGGTESMIFRGLVPEDLPLDATLGSLPGTFRHPFLYGYALAGRVAGVGTGVPGEWLGRRVFLFHPHQDRVVVPLGDCLPIPEGISARTALFAPNLESALSCVMDATPLAGERVAVFGQGVVGLLATAVLSRFPLERLIGVDPLASRRARSAGWGASEAVDPGDTDAWAALRRSLARGPGPRGADLCLELSGSIDGLNGALELTGFAGRILIGSWYGSGQRPVDLGGRFHRSRIRLIASQVSMIEPALTGRWDKARRMARVWEWLARLDPETLITHEFAPEDCQAAFELCSSSREGTLQVVFRYPAH